MLLDKDEHWMSLALEQAHKAAQLLEVPVGAVMVADDQIIARSHNLKETAQNPLGHAEILAIEKASKLKSNWRLNDCTLYVTLEPCIMCVGALIQARVGRIVYGARDPKAGAIGSVYKIFEDKKLNHNPKIQGGILELECSDVLVRFFKKLREKEALT